MRFLADQDVYAVAVGLLRAEGHDALTAREAGLATAADTERLAAAARADRILLTRDRDHGHLVFVRGLRCGVLYVRMTPGDRERVDRELLRALSLHKEDVLIRSFVVIQPDRHRLRQLDLLDRG